MPEEVAYLTPKVKTGNAYWIDFWNADLFDGSSHLQRMDSLDQVLFRAREHTWSYDFDVGYANGVIQCAFEAKEDDHYLIVAKLSSSSSIVNVYVNETSIGSSFVGQTGEEVVYLVSLKKGVHNITIKQWTKSIFGDPFSDMWFHSITIFQV